MTWLSVLRIAGPIVLGYLLGGVPFGAIVAHRFYGADITKLGSGATGGTNVYRNFGWKAGLAVIVLDVAKASIPTAVGLYVADPAWGTNAAYWLAIAAGLAAAAGHSYSPYYKLRGGKAVSSAGGIVIVLMPWAALILILFMALIIATVRIVSVASMLAAVLLPVLALLEGCGFVAEVARFRVLQAVEHFYDVAKGRMAKTRNTVILEDVYCTGGDLPEANGCERHCHYFWRTEWLEKIA